jgi:uncharacterized membrane protein YhiD involved in acid resistance
MLPSFEGAFDKEAVLLALDVLFKLGVAVVLGGAIGWERERSGRPAGVRTHMLMCLGVTLLSEVSKAFAPQQDTSRIAAQIVTGVGFLGAGSILRMGVEVRGLTTAASLWSAAAIGMAVSVGGGFYIVAVVATVMALITLTVVEEIERKYSGNGHAKSLMVGITTRDCIPRLLDALDNVKARVNGIQIEKATSGFLLRIDVGSGAGRAIEVAATVEGVESVTWAE